MKYKVWFATPYGICSTYHRTKIGAYFRRLSLRIFGEVHVPIVIHKEKQA